MKQSLLGVALISLAISIGMKSEVRIKKAIQINRNWKEDQDEENKKYMLEKARLKRIRKREIKRINLNKGYA